ncbi:unnamed protein product [Closterium sp. NIES-64]|nr:unnamed protein product [Closterium sp. NIES-64]
MTKPMRRSATLFCYGEAGSELSSGGTRRSEGQRAAAPRHREDKQEQGRVGGEGVPEDDQRQGTGSACPEGAALTGDQVGGVRGQSCALESDMSKGQTADLTQTQTQTPLLEGTQWVLRALASARASTTTTAASTTTTTAPAASTSTAATTTAPTPATAAAAASTTPTAATSPSSPATTPTAATTPTTASPAVTPTALASPALAAATPAGSGRRADLLSTKEVDSSSRGDRGEQGGRGNTPRRKGCGGRHERYLQLQYSSQLQVVSL